MAADGQHVVQTSYLQRQWGKLSLFQINLMCLLIVLAMTGAVSWTDMLYPVVSTLYIVFFAVKIFPPVSQSASESPFKGKRLFKFYITFAGLIGVLIPFVFIIMSLILGYRSGVASAAPHLFLLIAQIVTDGFSIDPAISTPVRVLIPASYNTKRLVTLLHWVQTVTSGEVQSTWMLPWQVVEALLAISNLVLWTYNLLGFLLPVYLPMQLRAYYKQEAALKASHSESAR